MTIYFHLDLDAFFASVEELKHPEYHHIPLIVGGKFDNSVCCSANYVARSYGVSAGMPAFMYKKLLPSNYVVVRTHHEQYEKVSQEVFSYIRQKYCREILIYSIDECWIHFEYKLSEEQAFNLAFEKAKKIQDDILKTFKLSISIGVSYSMFLAKMSSDLKKPMGIMLIKNMNDVKRYIWPMKIDKMFMVGKQLAKKLNKINIYTIQDLAMCQDYASLKKILTKNYTEYLANARGESTVYVFRNEKPKSVSVKQTFGVANINDDILAEEIEWMCKQLVNNLYQNQAKAKRMQMVLEFMDHEEIKDIYNFDSLTASFEDLHHAASVLIERNYHDERLIRSLNYRIPELLYPKLSNQLTIIDDVFNNEEKKQDLQWQKEVIKMINTQQKETVANLPHETYDKNKKAFNH